MLQWRGATPDGLRQPFASAVTALLEADAEQWDIICAVRSMDAQAADYAQGRTTPGPIITHAQPGESPHNFGLAVDVVLVRNGQDVWNGDTLGASDPAYARIVAAVRASPWLHSGADFPGPFKDVPHIEAVGWHKLVLGLTPRVVSLG